MPSDVAACGADALEAGAAAGAPLRRRVRLSWNGALRQAPRPCIPILAPASPLNLRASSLFRTQHLHGDKAEGSSGAYDQDGGDGAHPERRRVVAP